MNIEEIRGKISVFNAEIAKLNTQRNQNIGRQQALNKQLQDAFALYKSNYGVELTSENLQSELDSVAQKKEEELRKIEQILGFINAGNISEANRLAGVSEPEVTVSIPEMQMSATEVTVPTVPTVPEIQVPEVSAPTPPPVVPPTSQITPPVQVAPPNAEVVTPPVAPPVAPPKPVLTGAESLEMGMSALEGFTKPSLGSITPPTPPAPPTQEPKTQIKDFGAVLNGTAFKPN